MKKTKIIYWIVTGLFLFSMLGSAIPDILVMQMAVDGFRDMGYPAYLVPFLGVAKALGVLAILIPGYPRIKEWAYAGLIFDLIGATYSVICIGEPLESWIFMVVIMILGFTSYYLHHKKMKASPSQESFKVKTAGIGLATA